MKSHFWMRLIGIGLLVTTIAFMLIFLPVMFVFTRLEVLPRSMLFINWLDSPEMQALMNSIVKVIPVRDDVQAEFIPDVQSPENATGWMPAAYKKYAAEQFTSQVLLH